MQHSHPGSPQCLLSFAAAGGLPFHDIEHADWQVAQGKDKENHHQHTGGLTPSSDLFDLGANCARPDPHRLRQPCSLSRALDRPPLPLQHRCVSRYLVVKYVDILDGWNRTEENHFSFDTWLCIDINLKNTYLLEPQLVTYLNICQDHETKRCKVCDDEETDVINLRIDLSYWKKREITKLRK